MIPILCVSPLLYSTQLSVCTFDNPDRIDFAKYWYHDYPIKEQLLVGTHNYLPVLFHFGYVALIVISAYIVAIILARMTLAEVNRNSHEMSPKIKVMQKQLERWLIYLLLKAFWGLSNMSDFAARPFIDLNFFS
jgi:hypothetical protein